MFTKEIELALLEKQIDFAVHSFKDVPVTMPLVDQSHLIIAAVPKRESPWDVLVSRTANSLSSLAPGSKVGTGSPRRSGRSSRGGRTFKSNRSAEISTREFAS